MEGNTVEIRGEDLNRIKEWNRSKLELELTRNLSADLKDEAAARRISSEPRKSEGYRRKDGYSQNEDELVREQRRPRKKDRHQEEDELNPGIERLLTGAGILVAIIIVAVLLVVFTKLGGVFQSGTGIFSGGNRTEASVEAGTQENDAASGTQIPMPDLRGMDEDAAEATLEQNFINMKRTYENFYFYIFTEKKFLCCSAVQLSNSQIGKVQLGRAAADYYLHSSSL